MTQEVKFFVAMEPVAQGRARISTRSGFPKAYDPQKSRDGKQYIRLAAAQAMKGRMLFEGALVLCVIAYRTPPKSASKKLLKLMLADELRPTTKPDIDNYLKLVKDALSGVVWRDDAQVVAYDGETSKRYTADKPGFYVEVRKWCTKRQP